MTGLEMASGRADSWEREEDTGGREAEREEPNYTVGLITAPLREGLLTSLSAAE